MPKTGEEKLAMFNPYGPVAIKSNSLKKMTYKAQDVIIVCMCVPVRVPRHNQRDNILIVDTSAYILQPTYFSLLVTVVSEMCRINHIERCK